MRAASLSLCLWGRVADGPRSASWAWPLQLYFQSLVLTMKMNSVHAGRGNAAKSNVDAQALYEQCVRERVPLAEWPTFVSGHF
jgi:hypothetical protein